MQLKKSLIGTRLVQMLAMVAGLLAITLIPFWAVEPAASSPLPQSTISVEKSVVTDLDPENGAFVRNNDVVTYTIRVRNTGSEPLNVESVTDNFVPGTFFEVECLPSEAACFTVTQRVTSTVLIDDKENAQTEQTFVVTITEAITWASFVLPPQGLQILQFVARVDCQQADDQINNVANVVFGPGGAAIESNTTRTTVQLPEVVQSAGGFSKLSGPSGCSREAGGVDQDWGDYDNDGDLDLALGTLQQISVYRNDAGRLSLAGSDTYTNTLLRGVRWADIDNDNQLELLSVGSFLEVGKFDLRRGLNYIYDANEFDEPSQSFTTSDVLWQLAFADYNLDGNLDLAAGSYFDPTAPSKHNLCMARIYDGHGDGTFTPNECLIGSLTKYSIWNPAQVRRSYDVAWGDLDVDGDLDLVFANYDTYNQVYENSLFQPSDFSIPLGSAPLPPGQSTSIALEDFNDNGFLDVASGNDGAENELFQQIGASLVFTRANWNAAADPTRSVAWGEDSEIPNPSVNIPLADDAYLEYNLPIDFRFGQVLRDIARISVSTNGIIELLSTSEICEACGSWRNNHAQNFHVLQGIDVIFAASADMYSSVLIEALPEQDPDRVEITWMGRAFDDGGRSLASSNIEQKSLMFKVTLHASEFITAHSRITWKFFNMNYDSPYPPGYERGDFFAGVYDGAVGEERPVAYPLDASPGEYTGYIPSSFAEGEVTRDAFEFTGNWNQPQIPEIPWDEDDDLITPFDNVFLEYDLPAGFPFEYYGRPIDRLCIDTNGVVELLQAGEDCSVQATPNFFTTSISESVDSIYAAGDNLRTGVFVTGSDERVTINWFGTTAADNNYYSNQLTFKVTLFPFTSTAVTRTPIWWNFFDMNYENFSSVLFSGLNGAGPDRDDGGTDNEGPSEVSIGSQNFQGLQVNRQFVASVGITPITPYRVALNRELFLAVGNFNGATKLYKRSDALDTLELAWQSSVSNATTSVAWVDYNGDGRDDLTVGNFGTENLVYLSPAEGDFLVRTDIPQQIGAAMSQTNSLDWADWDADVDPDLAVGNDQDNIEIYENLGQGNFVLATTLANTQSTQAVAWGDVNGDGLPDLAVANLGGPDQVYLNNGAGFLPIPGWTSLGGSDSRAVAWGDVDQDGDLDLAVARDGQPNALYRNRRFFEVNNVRREFGSVTALAWADYNNDGYPDLAIGGENLESPGGGFLYLVRNDQGNLTFSPAGTIELDQGNYTDQQAPAALFDLSWGDYNRDGWLDIVASYPALEQVRLYRNPGNNGTWATGQTLFEVPATALEWVDFQRDGWLDLAVAISANDITPTLRVYVNQSTGQFLDNDFIASDTDLTDGLIYSLRGLDRDNDGDVDLSAVNQGRESKQYTNFGGFLSTGLTSVGTFAANSVAWGDHNADGYQDLLFGGSNGGASPQSSRLYYSEDGAGFDLFGSSAADASLSFRSGGQRNARFGDFTADGQIDIVDGVPGGQVDIYANDDATRYQVQQSTFTLDFGDTDGDGYLDLFVGADGETPANNYVYLNLKQTPYYSNSNRWTSDENSPTSSVAWADYNDDNHLDFVVGNCGAPAIQLYRNSGSKSFELVGNSGLPADDICVTSVAWGDVDADGNVDLAIGSNDAPNTVYTYDATTNKFTSTWTAADTTATTAVAWGDWNSDGWLDLAVGNYNAPDRVYANLSTDEAVRLVWLWASEDSFATTGVAWGDWNADGDLDLAISQDNNGPNGIYENGYALPAHLGRRNMPLPHNPTYLAVARPGTADAYFISSRVLAEAIIPIDVTIFDPDGSRADNNPIGDPVINQPAGQYQFSLDGGVSWQDATITPTQSLTQSLTRNGTPITINWDAEADKAISDNARFRVTVVNDNAVGPVQSASSRAVSPPFRLISGLECQWPSEPSITMPAMVPVNEEVEFLGGLQTGTGVLTFTWTLDNGIAISPSQRVRIKFPVTGSFPLTMTVVGEPCPETRTVITTTLVEVTGVFSAAFLPYVSANNSVTSSTDSATYSQSTMAVPAAVTGLRGRMRLGQTTLTWHTVLTAAGYHVYRGPRDGVGRIERIGTVTHNQYVDIESACGHSYYVTAYNAGGESLPSTASYFTRPC